jgi:hypothetical protein
VEVDCALKGWGGSLLATSSERRAYFAGLGRERVENLSPVGLAFPVVVNSDRYPSTLFQVSIATGFYKFNAFLSVSKYPPS